MLKEDLLDRIGDIIHCKNIDNDNANVDQYSFSGREHRAGEVVHKEYSRDRLVGREVLEAFDDNKIYLHDFGKYSIGLHNCSFIDFEPLLKNGFTTRNGDVRGANSINTVFQLMAVIFQIQSQNQFGK